MLHTVILSDIHLNELLPGDETWMRFRQAAYAPDDEFVRLVDYLRATCGGDRISLVFNGDAFDFESPPVVNGKICFDHDHASEDASATRVARILADHPGFVEAAADLMKDGHEIVFVSGNHDAHLTFPAVRARLRHVLAQAAMARGASASHAKLSDQVVFRAWFHRTADGIHIEHGHQYDHYCAFRHPMEPFTPDGRAIQPTMGSLSYRHLIARMGYFNPHVDVTFMLSLGQYVGHWARYYARSSHSLATTWARGAINIMRELVTARPSMDPRVGDRGAQDSSRETGALEHSVRDHATLFASPVNEHAFSALRELWLDRAALGAAGVLAVAGASVAGPFAAATTALAGGAAIVAYENLVPKPPLDDTYAHAARCQSEIARIHGANAVVFGHTHQHFGRWADRVFFGNTGTWAPAYLDPDCTVPVNDGRPIVWLQSDGGELHGGLRFWRRGHVVEVAESDAVEASRRMLPAIA